MLPAKLNCYYAIIYLFICTSVWHGAGEGGGGGGGGRSNYISLYIINIDYMMNQHSATTYDRTFLIHLDTEISRCQQAHTSSLTYILDRNKAEHCSRLRLELFLDFQRTPGKSPTATSTCCTWLSRVVALST